MNTNFGKDFEPEETRKCQPRMDRNEHGCRKDEQEETERTENGKKSTTNEHGHADEMAETGGACGRFDLADEQP